MSDKIDHPKPVDGAARYWAIGNNVHMQDTDGYYNVIETKANPLSAAKAAAAWQKRENKAVEKSLKK